MKPSRIMITAILYKSILKCRKKTRLLIFTALNTYKNVISRENYIIFLKKLWSNCFICVWNEQIHYCVKCIQKIIELKFSLFFLYINWSLQRIHAKALGKKKGNIIWLVEMILYIIFSVKPNFFQRHWNTITDIFVQ